ncbi:hypothetical protein NLM33_23230 [Bradyrhizobium sp. CCGUVB1N3]|uniref:hypothetical protein n=1 Tax=Bradyrhizobium sp. CCGUVB1N3 TaxID=2949629 RepID=UPI0020B39476|nr:hypothetical protein [Bradyrhizobium sp. CCGUVB1N3]MCP3473229.1 hypothetical protein [Bradyrhizobium sp. CCGUVB1N3]
MTPIEWQRIMVAHYTDLGWKRLVANVLASSKVLAARHLSRFCALENAFERKSMPTFSYDFAPVLRPAVVFFYEREIPVVTLQNCNPPLLRLSRGYRDDLNCL